MGVFFFSFYTSYECGREQSLAVSLQVVDAAWLVAALLHDASLDLGLITAGRSLPEPLTLLELLLSTSFGQEPF